MSPAEHRYLMTVIATASNPRFTVSRVDIDRPGPTYTIDTLRDLRAQRGPDADLFFITGADALAQILTWKDADELFAARPLHRGHPARATTLSGDGLPGRPGQPARGARDGDLVAPTAATGCARASRSGTSCPTASCSTSPSTASTARAASGCRRPGGRLMGRHGSPSPTRSPASTSPPSSSRTGPTSPASRAGREPAERRHRRRCRRHRAGRPSRAGRRAGRGSPGAAAPATRRGRAGADGRRPPRPAAERAARRARPAAGCWSSAPPSSPCCWSSAWRLAWCSGGGDERRPRRRRRPPQQSTTARAGRPAPTARPPERPGRGDQATGERPSPLLIPSAAARRRRQLRRTCRSARP